MEITSVAPKVPVSNFKRTKIVASLGPATHNYDTIKEMINVGVNAFRLTFSHGEHSEKLQQLKWIREASKACGKPVAVIQDLQGPKIRLGDFEGVVNVKEGEVVRLRYGADYEKEGVFPVQYDLSTKVKTGERLYINDGRVRGTVAKVEKDVLHVRIENDGILLKRKGINLPDTNFGGDILTEKDMRDIAFAADKDFDYVALSFVQNAGEVKEMRKILRDHKSTAQIIVKIETKAAIENLESIIAETDAVMVARGDLAFETEPESVPVLQRKMVSLCIKYHRPVIIATQMMASMMDSPEPTRAEVSDVATAVFIGADAVMLSDETTVGKYPIESVKMMKRIIKYTENNIAISPVNTTILSGNHTQQDAISGAIMSLADSLNVVAIVAETSSGATAHTIASRRCGRPIIAVTSSTRVAQQLALVYSVKSFVRRDSATQAQKLTEWLMENKVLKKGDITIAVSGKYPGVVGTTDTIKVRVLE